MRVLAQDASEEWRAGRQDNLVSLDLSGATAESYVKEVLLFSNLPERHTYVALKIIPAKTKLLIRPHGCNIMKITTLSENELSCE